jgi:hypothetical protein
MRIARAPGAGCRSGASGTVYVLDFEPAYKHAGHYVGWTEGDVCERVAVHLQGRGSPLIRAAVAAGVDMQLAATYEHQVPGAAVEALAQQQPLLRHLPRPPPGRGTVIAMTQPTATDASDRFPPPTAGVPQGSTNQRSRPGPDVLDGQFADEWTTNRSGDWVRQSRPRTPNHPRTISWSRPMHLYSTNLGTLRADRAACRAQQDKPDVPEDEDSIPVLSCWEYLRSGYLSPGDALLAAGVEALAASRERSIARRAPRSAIGPRLGERRVSLQL